MRAPPSAGRVPSLRTRLAERLLPDDDLAINRWPWCDVVETAEDTGRWTVSATPLQLVVVNNTVQLQACTLYVSHHCAIVENHHVCPDSWWQHAGKDPNLSPMKVLCPNCHMNTHAAIDGIIKGQVVSLIPMRCQALARQAFDIAAQNGLTPALTL